MGENSILLELRRPLPPASPNSLPPLPAPPSLDLLLPRHSSLPKPGRDDPRMSQSLVHIACARRVRARTPPGSGPPRGRQPGQDLFPPGAAAAPEGERGRAQWTGAEGGVGLRAEPPDGGGAVSVPPGRLPGSHGPAGVSTGLEGAYGKAIVEDGIREGRREMRQAHRAWACDISPLARLFTILVFSMGWVCMRERQYTRKREEEEQHKEEEQDMEI